MWPVMTVLPKKGAGLSLHWQVDVNRWLPAQQGFRCVQGLVHSRSAASDPAADCCSRLWRVHCLELPLVRYCYRVVGDRRQPVWQKFRLALFLFRVEVEFWLRCQADVNR